MTATRFCASNELYSGRATDLRHAMQLTVLMCLQQRWPDPKVYPIDQGGTVEHDTNNSLDAMRGYAQAVLSMMDWMRKEELDAIMEEWQDSKDATMQLIANAFMEDDYTQLAV